MAVRCPVVHLLAAALAVRCASDLAFEWQDTGLSLLQRGSALLPAPHAAPPWPAASQVPGGCVPEVLVPRYGRCLFGYQCATGLCSAFLRVCLANDEDVPPPRAVRADSVLRHIFWESCQGRHRDCRTCEFSPHNLEDFQLCAEDPFSPGRPSLSLFDPSDPICGCHDDFVALYHSEAWVDCGSGGEESSLEVVRDYVPPSPCERAGKACSLDAVCGGALGDMEAVRAPRDRLSRTLALCQHKEALLLLLQMWIACPLSDGTDPLLRPALEDVKSQAAAGSLPDRYMCSFIGGHRLLLERLLPQADLLESSDVIRQLNPSRKSLVLSAERRASHRFKDRILEELPHAR